MLWQFPGPPASPGQVPLQGRIEDSRDTSSHAAFVVIFSDYAKLCEKIFFKFHSKTQIKKNKKNGNFPKAKLLG